MEVCHLSLTQKGRYNKEKETPAGVNQTFGHKTSLAKSTANGRGGGATQKKAKAIHHPTLPIVSPPPPSPSPSSESYEGRRKRDPKLPRQRDYWKLVKGPSFSSPHFTILPSPTSLPSTPPFAHGLRALTPHHILLYFGTSFTGPSQYRRPLSRERRTPSASKSPASSADLAEAFSLMFPLRPTSTSCCLGRLENIRTNTPKWLAVANDVVALPPRSKLGISMVFWHEN